jgi:hypothetical protein
MTTDHSVEDITEYIANTNTEHYDDTIIFRKQIKNINTTPVIKTEMQNITTPIYRRRIESARINQSFPRYCNI